MKTEINVMPTPGKENTLTVLEGKALEQKPANVIAISGDINTVKAYIQKRYSSKPETIPPVNTLLEKFPGNLQIIDNHRSVILVDKYEKTIELQVDPQDYYGPRVMGKLEESEELKRFKINEEFEWNKVDLVKLIRFSRRFFADSDKHAELLQSYQVFNAKVYADLLQADDGRGNLHNSYKQTVKTGIPEEFTLMMPIFKGQPEEKFRVNIYIRVVDGGARFWFESVELDELIQTRTDKIFAEQLEGCEDFVIVNK